MDLSAKLKRSYLLQIKDQLVRQGYTAEDINAVTLGLSEHIDEEIWRIKQDQGQVDSQVMQDVLANLELPEEIEAPAMVVPARATWKEVGMQQLAKVSSGLALLAVPLFYVAGIFSSDVAFDILFLLTLAALSMAMISSHTRLGRQALLVCVIPGAVLLAFILPVVFY